MLRMLLSCVAMGVLAVNALPAQAAEKDVPEVLKYDMKTLDGKPVELSKYAGKVLLLVNTASFCGATPQYEGLQELHEEFADDGLAVLGFPCNQFGAQEPGSAAEIAKFCDSNYKVSFDMFDKIEVNGDGQAPLYKYLTSEATNPKTAGPVKWNFEKFLIGRDGSIVERFRTGVEPTDLEVKAAIRTELAKTP